MSGERKKDEGRKNERVGSTCWMFFSAQATFLSLSSSALKDSFKEGMNKDDDNGLFLVVTPCEKSGELA